MRATGGSVYNIHRFRDVHGGDVKATKKDNLATARLDYRDLERIEVVMYRDDRSRSYVIKKAVKLGLDAMGEPQPSSSARTASSSSSSSKPERGR